MSVIIFKYRAIIKFYTNECEEVSTLPNTAEVVSDLATKLAYQKVIADLQECKSVDDIKVLIEKYKALCES